MLKQKLLSAFKESFRRRRSNFNLRQYFIRHLPNNETINLSPSKPECFILSEATESITYNFDLKNGINSNEVIVQVSHINEQDICIPAPYQGIPTGYKGPYFYPNSQSKKITPSPGTKKVKLTLVNHKAKYFDECECVVKYSTKTLPPQHSKFELIKNLTPDDIYSIKNTILNTKKTSLNSAFSETKSAQYKKPVVFKLYEKTIALRINFEIESELLGDEFILTICFWDDNGDAIQSPYYNIPTGYLGPYLYPQQSKMLIPPPGAQKVSITYSENRRGDETYTCQIQTTQLSEADHFSKQEIHQVFGKLEIHNFNKISALDLIDIKVNPYRENILHKIEQALGVDVKESVTLVNKTLLCDTDRNTFQLRVIPQHNYKIKLSTEADDLAINDGCLMQIRFLDKDKNILNIQSCKSFSHSKTSGLFRYVALKENKLHSQFDIEVPLLAKHLVINFRPFKKAKAFYLHELSITKGHLITLDDANLLDLDKLGLTNTNLSDSDIKFACKNLLSKQAREKLTKFSRQPKKTNTFATNTAFKIDPKNNNSILKIKSSSKKFNLPFLKAKEISISLRTNKSFGLVVEYLNQDEQILKTDCLTGLSENNEPEKFENHLISFVQTDTLYKKVRCQIFNLNKEYSLKICNQLPYSALESGISIIIPAYKSQSTIKATIDSLIAQHYTKFEILVILNGKPDKTEQILKQAYPNEPRLRVLRSNAGAGTARNKGIAEARFLYTTFIDADDYVNPEYLMGMVVNSSPNTTTFAYIEDFTDNGDYSEPEINKQLQGKNYFSLNEAPSFITMNACKLVPTYYIKQTLYNTSLHSGEDVCYFTELYSKSNITLHGPDNQFKPVYYRRLTNNSVSRQQESYNFNVEQRLKCIESLNCLLPVTSPYIESFIKSKIWAQACYIENYLETHPGEIDQVMKDTKELDPYYFPYEKINSNLVDTIVISYCFAPYIDTSGVIMLKRIRERNYTCDVISNNMASVRQKDSNLIRIAQHNISKINELTAPTSFADPNAIIQFAEMAYATYVNLLEQRQRPYRNVYSRIMWPASHFTAAKIKLSNPDIHWVAEFSDPLLKDINAEQRYQQISNKWLNSLALDNHLKAAGLDFPDNDNLYFWGEFLPYLLADELLFTNKNQLEYMLSYADNETIKKLMTAKATVTPHPTLPRSFYNITNTKAQASKETVNIGYFGSFYGSRNLNDVTAAIQKYNDSAGNKKAIALHVYTNSKELAMSEVTPDYLHLHGYLDYMKFLNVCDQMDCLIVTDAKTEGIKPVNPYLPSKVSDYIGSKSDVWALVEANSPMSNLAEIEFKSLLNDPQDIYTSIQLIASKHQ